MAKAEKRELEIAEDRNFQRASWRVQRAGWVVMILLAFAALAGLFGGGPLSHSVAGGLSSGVALEYERFTRLYAPQAIAFEIAPAGMESDSVARIWIDRRWIDSNQINEISPEPVSSELDADRIVYTFKVKPSPDPLRVRFNLENRAMGRVRGRAGLVNGAALSFSQFAYP
jgi:hypothetical protein